MRFHLRISSLTLLAALCAAPAAYAQDATLPAYPTVSTSALGANLPTPAWLPSATPKSAPDVSAETTIFGLPKNVGPVDRVLRGVVAAALIGLGTWAVVDDDVSDGAGAAMLSVAAVPAATGATGYCPLYQLLGIDTSF